MFDEAQQMIWHLKSLLIMKTSDWTLSNLDSALLHYVAMKVIYFVRLNIYVSHVFSAESKNLRPV